MSKEVQEAGRKNGPDLKVFGLPDQVFDSAAKLGAHLPRS